ncbi:MAG: hypothetical protein Kow0042_23970 [Calditrichia bacterium]
MNSKEALSLIQEEGDCLLWSDFMEIASLGSTLVPDLKKILWQKELWGSEFIEDFYAVVHAQRLLFYILGENFIPEAFEFLDAVEDDQLIDENNRMLEIVLSNDLEPAFQRLKNTEYPFEKWVGILEMLEEVAYLNPEMQPALGEQITELLTLFEGHPDHLGNLATTLAYLHYKPAQKTVEELYRKKKIDNRVISLGDFKEIINEPEDNLKRNFLNRAIHSLYHFDTEAFHSSQEQLFDNEDLTDEKEYGDDYLDMGIDPAHSAEYQWLRDVDLSKDPKLKKAAEEILKNQLKGNDPPLVAELKKYLMKRRKLSEVKARALLIQGILKEITGIFLENRPFDEHKYRQALHQIIQISQEELCYCDSGKKFENCCERK